MHGVDWGKKRIGFGQESLPISIGAGRRFESCRVHQF